MKKWFNWQLKNQVQNTFWENNGNPILNLKSEMEWFSNYITDGLLNKTLSSYFDNVFYREDWIKKASDSTDGIVSAEELKEWIFDKELSSLMDRQGVEYIIDFEKNIENKLLDIFEKNLNLKRDLIHFRVHLQRPGQMFALHFDRNKYLQFDVLKPEQKYETNSKIFLILLKDQALGQVFQIGKEQIKWNAGDVFTWSQTDIPHGSANFGLENRLAILVTGFLK